jgi:multidrug resistance efflux pump
MGLRRAIEDTEEELAAAEKKIEELTSRVERLDKESTKTWRVREILIAGGFITREKFEEAERLIADLP